MITRVYISTTRGIISGEFDDDVRTRANEYVDFFEVMDSQGDGKGYFEIKLPPIKEQTDEDNKKRDVFLRATADGYVFGHYGHEGWEKLRTDFEVKKDNKTVMFDSMVLYYAYKDLTSDFSIGSSYEETVENIHSDDISEFEEIFEEYIESRKNEEE